MIIISGGTCFSRSMVEIFFFLKLVSDDLKWSEMPKKHDFHIFVFGEKFTSPTRNDDRGGKFFFQK